MNLNATDSHSGAHLTQREARSAPGATAAAASTAVPRVELLRSIFSRKYLALPLTEGGEEERYGVTPRSGCR